MKAWLKPGKKRSATTPIPLTEAESSSSDTERAASASSSKSANSVRKYNPDWESDYFFVPDADGKRPLCLLCFEVLCEFKKDVCRRHYEGQHPEVPKKYPHGHIRDQKIAKRKKVLASSRGKLRTFLSVNEATTQASFQLGWKIANSRRPQIDGEWFKETLLKLAPTLFDDFQNKNKIMSRIQALQASDDTVGRRVKAISQFLFANTVSALKECLAWSLSIDASSDICDWEQLVLWVTFSSIGKTSGKLEVSKKFLTMLTLADRTRGEDIFDAVKKFCLQNDLPFSKLFSACTDGCPAMLGSTVGFCSLLSRYFKENGRTNSVEFFHCIIHQQALCGKVINMDEVLREVVEVVNAIRSSKLAHRQFKSMLEDLDSEFSEIPYFTAVRWLSKGKTLQRFYSLREEVKLFIAGHSELSRKYSYVDDFGWLVKVAFLNDVTSEFNKLNLALQGANNSLSDMICAIGEFRLKVNMWIDKLCSELPALVSLENVDLLMKQNPTMVSAAIPHFLECLHSISDKFAEWFETEDFRRLRMYCRFMSSPAHVDQTHLDTISERLNIAPSSLKSDVLKIKVAEDLLPSGRVISVAEVADSRHPAMQAAYAKLSTVLVTTYDCEFTFSALKNIKTRHRSRMTNENLDANLRCALENVDPDFKSVQDCNISQLHPSH